MVFDFGLIIFMLQRCRSECGAGATLCDGVLASWFLQRFTTRFARLRKATAGMLETSASAKPTADMRRHGEHEGSRMPPPRCPFDRLTAERSAAIRSPVRKRRKRSQNVLSSASLKRRERTADSSGSAGRGRRCRASVSFFPSVPPCLRGSVPLLFVPVANICFELIDVAYTGNAGSGDTLHILMVAVCASTRRRINGKP